MIIGNFDNDMEEIQPWDAFVLNLNHILFMEHYYFLSVFYYMFPEYMKVSTFLTFTHTLWFFLTKTDQHFAQIWLKVEA